MGLPFKWRRVLIRHDALRLPYRGIESVTASTLLEGIGGKWANRPHWLQLAQMDSEPYRPYRKEGALAPTIIRVRFWCRPPCRYGASSCRRFIAPKTTQTDQTPMEDKIQNLASPPSSPRNKRGKSYIYAIVGPIERQRRYSNTWSVRNCDIDA